MYLLYMFVLQTKKKRRKKCEIKELKKMNI